MIYQLKGRIISKNGLLIIMDVVGIGYGIFAPMSTILKLPEVGQEVLLHTHLVVREDAHLLYGFLDEREKFLFCELIKISGFGPKLGLAILSHLSIEQFYQSITLQDTSRLVDIPGVGQKTAQRLMVEMQNKINSKKFISIINGVNNTINDQLGLIINQNITNDAEEALVSLGYKQKEAMLAIKTAINDYKNNKVNTSISSEQLIKSALKNLSKAYV
ncbi:MAG: Holliday junction branch migration protein RuvA [Gammaproteobacteria bacterium]|jgi:Holliday junction DNA helicase RuvA